MRIALEVWSADYEQVEATCRHAERLGFDGFYYGESPHDLNLDCWTTLAALARATDRIRLGPVIANVLPTYRSTVLLARQAATVAAVAGGRLDFRTGVGASARFGRAWWEPFGVRYPGYDERLSDLRAALADLRRLWAGTPTVARGAEVGGEASGDGGGVVDGGAEGVGGMEGGGDGDGVVDGDSGTESGRGGGGDGGAEGDGDVDGGTDGDGVVDGGGGTEGDGVGDGVGDGEDDGGVQPPVAGSGRIPVTIAARGERAMRLAAEQADVWETSFCTPDEFASARARLARWLDGRVVTRSLEIDGFVSCSDEGVARLLDRVRAERGRTEDLDAIFRRALLGTPDRAAERLGELARAGVDQVVVALHDPHDLDGLEALALAAARL